MSGDRLAAPDVLRGLAIAGTFATNVWLFADPAGPLGILSGTTVGWWPDDLLTVLTNGKFLGLLTLLFGIGMELQYRSAVRRGLRWPGRYLARAAILFTEGMLHYVLVFEFDVLMGYAIASVLVAWLVGRSSRVRVVAAALAGGFVVLVAGGLTAALLTGPESADTGGLPPYPATWTGQVWARLTEAWLYRIELVLVVPSAVVLFLAGSALLRAGVFAEGATRLRRRMILAGVAGVVANASTALAGPEWFAVERYLAAPLVSVGLLGLVPEVLARLRGPAGRMRRGLTAIGRTAMTCYVGQNLVAGALFHAWGAGLAVTLAAAPAPLRTAAVVAVWVAVLVLSAALASWWLGRHPRGPLETVTHALLRDRSPASRRGARTR